MTPNKQTKALNSVYLFFSNTGTTNIIQHALKRIRKDITIKEMEEIISKTLTNGTGNVCWCHFYVTLHVMTIHFTIYSFL